MSKKQIGLNKLPFDVKYIPSEGWKIEVGSIAYWGDSPEDAIAMYWNRYISPKLQQAARYREIQRLLQIDPTGNWD